MGWEPSKLLLTGGGDCEERKKSPHYFGLSPPSFINIVEAGKFPAAFRQFKNEANRCVFPVVWSILERAVDPILPVGFFVWFGAFKALAGICLAFEDFVIPAGENLLVLYRFYPIRHREWEFRNLRDRSFIAGNDCRFEFLPERRELGFCKRVWKRQQNPNPG